MNVGATGVGGLPGRAIYRRTAMSATVRAGRERGMWPSVTFSGRRDSSSARRELHHSRVLPQRFRASQCARDSSRQILQRGGLLRNRSSHGANQPLPLLLREGAAEDLSSPRPGGRKTCPVLSGGTNERIVWWTRSGGPRLGPFPRPPLAGSAERRSSEGAFGSGGGRESNPPASFRPPTDFEDRNVVPHGRGAMG
jgi:hypothetical protein